MSDLPKKQPRYLLEFAYGADASTFARVTNWSDEVTHDGDAYSPVPLMEVRVPASTGLFQEKSLEIEVPVSAHALFAALASGEPHSPCYVTVVHVAEPLPDDGGAAVEVVACLYWRVGLAVKNATGKRGIVRLEAADSKNEMHATVGLPANYQCTWTLFGRGCDLEVISDGGTLTAIDATDRRKVTITGVTTSPGVPGTPGNVYHRGYVERDGLRIEIREYSSAAASTFYLVRKPPAAWVGQAVTVYVGCDKSKETCNSRFANLARFQGPGYKIPSRHPVHEVES